MSEQKRDRRGGFAYAIQTFRGGYDDARGLVSEIEADAVAEERERLKDVLPRLLDSYTADVIRHVEGAPGAGNDRAKAQAKILAALDSEGEGEGDD